MRSIAVHNYLTPIFETVVSISLPVTLYTFNDTFDGEGIPNEILVVGLNGLGKFWYSMNLSG